MAGFPIVLLLLEGLRCIPHGEFPGGQTARGEAPFHALHFEHEDEHVHEHEE